ncbi:MAG: hypothetical protein ACI865_001223 [Flavobacteriaceae bacterium]|jgi:hypothetical protein
MIKALIILLGIIVLLGCKKSEDRACFKSGGEHAVKEISPGAFNQLELGPRIRYILVQDTVEKVIVSGGKNLINFIETNIEDGILTIENTNKCNFLRNLSLEVVVEVHLKSVHYVVFRGTKSLTCRNQLNLPNLTFIIDEGAGLCDLNVNSETFVLVANNGWGNFKLHGVAKYMRLDIRTNGFGNAYDINVTDSLHIISSTSELVKIDANGIPLRAEISSYGDVWYIGAPSSIVYNRYGEGDLVNKN